MVLSALGVGESRNVSPFFIRWLADYTTVGRTVEDHDTVDAEIERNYGEHVTWTSTMAVILTDAGDKPVKTFGVTQTGASMFVTRESVARWIVDVAAGRLGDEFNDKRVIASN